MEGNSIKKLVQIFKNVNIIKAEELLEMKRE